MKGDVRTVLVVDDDPEDLDFLSRAIGSEYPVLCATNGADAVRLAQKAEPDVIVLDVMMLDGKDGFATYVDLQSDARTRDIPVIMLSEVIRKTGLPFGVEEMKQYPGQAPAAWLEKPVSGECLLNEISRIFQRQPEVWQHEVTVALP